MNRYHLLAAVACLPLMLTGCNQTAPDPNATVQKVGNMINGVATAAGIVSKDISTACQYAPGIISVAQTLAKGGANNTVSKAASLIAASCTVAGQVALTLNNAKTVSAANSGDSAAWVLSVAQGALQAVAPPVAPIVP